MEEKNDDESSIDARKSGIPENSDEEFSLDFSKIKSFFKRKKESQEKKPEVDAQVEKNIEETKQENKIDLEKQESENKDDEDISIDLLKIKGMFKKAKNSVTEEGNKIQGPDKEKKQYLEPKIDLQAVKEKQEVPKTAEKKDDEISIDLSKIKNLFKKFTRDEEDKKKSMDEKSSVAEKEQKISRQVGPMAKEKDDDEIAIDLSWVKNIFKKKESDKEEQKLDAKEEKEDEISIDFSKIKNIKNLFKKSTETKDEEDISIDFIKIKDFIVRYRVLLLLVIPIFLSIFLRVQPAFLPITDEWATNNVIDSIRSQIRGQINQQYPNLPDQNKNVLVENELQKLLQQQKSQVDQQIAATSNALKARLQDDTGQTYLVAIDPFFWMRHAQNVLKNGHPGDEIRDGQIWDNHMYAPTGRGIPPDVFHAYFIAFLFKFLSFFNSNLGLMSVTFYVPVIISALSVIPAFFITRKIAGDFAGFIAATIIAIHPSFLTRTVGGFADTDAYNVTFPLFIAWLFLEALEAKKTKNSIILSAVSGLLIGFYSITWGGWWYIFNFILASTVFYVAYYSFVHRREIIRNFFDFVKQKSIKNSLAFLAVFFVVSALSVTLFVNYPHFSKFITNPTGFAKLKEVGITTIWPNVFTTVAEQNPASLDNVINQVGLGKAFFFLIAVMGITLTVTRREHKKWWFIGGALVYYLIIFFLKVQNLNTFLILISVPIVIRILIALWESDTEINIKYGIFLVLWFIATTFASTKGVRFTLLLVPAFGIGFGIAFGELYKYLSLWITKFLQVNRLISKVTVMVVLLLLLIAPYSSAKRTAEQEIPSFNDAWAISLEKIKQDSKPNAIINSWWDFGHWFKFWADRAVTFDGTSQNTPQAHWIGKVLLTDDEERAIGILRLLDCSGGPVSGGTKAFGLINDRLNDSSTTVALLKKIIVMDKEEAREVLNINFSQEEIDDILEQTHCQPPENYFITSEDMIGKSGVWAHFGSWDFDRALIYNTLKKKEYSANLDKSVNFLQERFNFSKEQAENLYYDVQSITTSDQANNWIAPWPGYAGATGCNKNEDVVTCNNGFIINLTSNAAFANTPQGVIHPKKLSIPTNEGIIVKEYNESVFTLQNGRGLGLALIKTGDNYDILQMDTDLTASMFTRLFYQEGVGLRYFKKFSDERSIFGGRIIVWKVDWEGKEKNIIKVPEPELQEDEKNALENININETEEIEDNITEVGEEINDSFNKSQNSS